MEDLQKPASLWTELRSSEAIDRALTFGAYTIPYLTHGQDRGEAPTNPQKTYAAEIGALLVNSLGAKLTGILFPTQQSFFTTEPDREFLERQAEHGYDERTVRQVLTRATKKAQEALMANRGYGALATALLHLIVSGNVCIVRKDKATRVFGLDNFVVQRTGDGRVLRAVIREHTVLAALPERIREAILTSKGYTVTDQNVKSVYSKSVALYTRLLGMYRGKTFGYVVQEFADDIPTTPEKWYPEGTVPYIFPTWTLMEGAHYGRGYVEVYASAFRILAELQGASAEYAMHMMHFVYVASALSGTQSDDLSVAERAEVVRADPDSVVQLELPNSTKLTQVDAKLEALIARLQKAFMYTGNTRNAERVTAYELQRDAQEAEAMLGGVYSHLSAEIQLPLAKLLLQEVASELTEGILSKHIQPVIITGLASIGAAGDLQKLLLSAQQMTALAPMIQLDKRINPQLVTDFVYAANGFDVSRIFFTEDEQRANDEAAAAQEAANQSLMQAQNLAENSESIQAALQG